MHLTTSLLKRIFGATKAISSHTDERIIIACMPKSASTFLRNVMMELTGYESSDLCQELYHDQDLYFPDLIDVAFKGIATHMHMTAKQSNVDLMKRCGLKPVVLVRNIFDCMVSMRDHCSKTPVFGVNYMGEAYNRADEKTRADIVIDMIGPWYIAFYASWKRAEENGDIDVHWLTYEDLIAYKQESVSTICDYYDIKKPSHEIEAAITAIDGDRARCNFNVGKVGRGKEQLTEEQHQKIIRMARYYDDIDFSMIGIKRAK